MQCLSLDHLRKLIAEGVFIPPRSEGSPELSRTTAILLVFQADSQHEEIMDVYLYTLDQILDFVKEIEVDLEAVRDALKAGGNPGKRCAFCLFVSNFGGAMAIPTDPPYCLVYPTCYLRDVDPDHFDTCNNLAGTHLHCRICHTALQSMMNPESASTMPGATSSCPSGLSTMIGCSLLSSSHRITAAR